MSYPLIRNICFSGNLACFVFLKLPFWDFPICFITDKLQYSNTYFMMFRCCFILWGLFVLNIYIKNYGSRNRNFGIALHGKQESGRQQFSVWPHKQNLKKWLNRSTLRMQSWLNLWQVLFNSDLTRKYSFWGLMLGSVAKFCF